MQSKSQAASNDHQRKKPKREPNKDIEAEFVVPDEEPVWGTLTSQQEKVERRKPTNSRRKRRAPEERTEEAEKVEERTTGEKENEEDVPALPDFGTGGKMVVLLG